MQNLCIHIFLALSLFFIPFTHAIEKEKLKAFFQEYNASAERGNWNWERLPYAIEKGYPDVAKFLVLNGDLPTSYYERLPSPVIGRYKPDNTYHKHSLITAIRQDYLELVALMAPMIKDLSTVLENKHLYVKYSTGYHYVNIEKKDALLIAITESSKSYEMTRALLDAGANINMQHNAYNVLSGIPHQKIKLGR